MAVAGGVAVLAVAAGLMAPPPATNPVAAAARAAAPGAALRQAGPALPVAPTGAGSPMAPAAMPAPFTTAAGPAAPPPPRAADDPTTTLAQAVPQRVPLAREQRDPTAQARLEAAAMAPPTAPAALATAPSPSTEAPSRNEPARARVGEADLGLRLMPGSRPLPDSGKRVPDGAGGEALALSLAGNGTLDAAVQFYRQQLVADGLAADAVQVLRPGDGQALLRAQSPQGGEHTVWIVQNGNTLDIVLARVRPGPSAPR